MDRQKHRVSDISCIFQSDSSSAKEISAITQMSVESHHTQAGQSQEQSPDAFTRATVLWLVRTEDDNSKPIQSIDSPPFPHCAHTPAGFFLP